jgi:hypothetical protein
MTLATKLRDNKPVYTAVGAGDLAVEKLRELPDTVIKIRETVAKYRVEVRDNVAKYRVEVRDNVTKLQERVDTSDLPGAAVSYVTHAGSRAVELIDVLAERGKKVVNKAEEVGDELEAGAKETVRKTKAVASQTKKTAQAAAKKASS